MKSNFKETVGWLGVIAILGAYTLTNFELLDFKSNAYHVMNLAGSLAILWHSWVKRDYQPVAINAVWAVVAAIGLVSLLQ